MRRLSRRRLLGGLAFGVLAVALATGAQRAESADASLAFFDTVEKVPPTHPERYERMVQSRGTELYVARVPALVIRTNEIMSVVVDRTGHDFRATISIAPDAAQRLHQFTERNVGKRMDIRFNGERLSTPLIVAPVPSGLMALGVGQSEARINRVFAPLGSKLSWKRDGR